MGTGIFRHIIQFIILVVIQVTVLNNIRFGGYVNPYVYVLFVLLLPIDIPGWLLLASAFVMGLTIDLFSDTQGMHAAATVFLAFTRPGVIRMITGRWDFDPGTIPSISSMGVRWIVLYSIVLVFIHHSLLFFLEIFRFSEFFITLGRIGLSTAITTIMVYLGFLLLDNPDRRKR
ncbi:MAG: rod shape-determining protein MreD [Bacteroides sp.]|jgi:rod shape-determining protein MreD|nr:rod shape-determining protein MreD [Bacteroides sp.]